MFQELCQCIYSKHLNSLSKTSRTITGATTHYTVNTSGELYVNLYSFPEEKNPHIMRSKISFDMNEIILFIIEKKNEDSMLDRFWHLIQDCK